MVKTTNGEGWLWQKPPIKKAGYGKNHQRGRLAMLKTTNEEGWLWQKPPIKKVGYGDDCQSGRLAVAKTTMKRAGYGENRQ